MASYETRVRLISETSINTANNTSYVTIAFEFRRTDYSYRGWNLQGNAYWYITCDSQSSGSRYFTFDWSVGQNVWKEVGRQGFTVTHNADGSKSISMSGYIFFGSGVAPGSLSGSGSAALTKIPRATVPTVSPVCQTIGEAITINLPRAAEAFTHNLTYKFGALTGEIIKGAGTSAVFELPEEFAEQIPNAEQGTGTITCQTYNGSTLIGTKTVSFTAVVPDTLVPVIHSVVISEGTEGVEEKFGTFLQNKSQLHVVTDASGAGGSTISKCEVLVNGVMYSGEDITSYIVTSSGDISVVVTVTDSRGRTDTQTERVVFLEYHHPQITSFTAVRCDNAGEEDDEGTSVRLEMDFLIAPADGKNEKSYKVQLKRQDEDAWMTIVNGSQYAYHDTYVKAGEVLNADYSYAVRLVVADYFAEAVAEVEIGTAFTLMDFHSSGRAMAFGKVSQKPDWLEVALDMEIQKNAEIVDEDEEGNEIRWNILGKLKEFGTKIASLGTAVSELNRKLSNMNTVVHSERTYPTVPKASAAIVYETTLKDGIYFICANLESTVSSSAGMNMYITAAPESPVTVRGDMQGGGGINLLKIIDASAAARDIAIRAYNGHSAAIQLRVDVQIVKLL